MRSQSMNMVLGSWGSAGISEAGHAGRVGAARALYSQEGEEAHAAASKYTALDSHIIIITAALLLLLLSILALHFLIRWLLQYYGRFSTSTSKPSPPRKGLTHLQLQALPTFIYSCPPPPPPISPLLIRSSHAFSKPTTLPFGYTNYTPNLAKPSATTTPSLSCTTVDEMANHTSEINDVRVGKGATSLILECTKIDEVRLIRSHVGDDDASRQRVLGCTKVDEVASFGAPTLDMLGCTKVVNLGVVDTISLAPNVEVDDMVENVEVDDMVEGDNPIVVCTTTPPNEVASKHAKANATSPTPIIDCPKVNEVANHISELNASSPTCNPCPICLIDFANGDRIRVLPTCQHYFHVQCVDIWLSKSSSCPACRANLVEATKKTSFVKQLALQVHVVVSTSH